MNAPSKHPGGRPPDPRRRRYIKEFGVRSNQAQASHLLGRKLLDQLDGCADDSARRVLLGKGRPFESREAVTTVTSPDPGAADNRNMCLVMVELEAARMTAEKLLRMAASRDLQRLAREWLRLAEHAQNSHRKHCAACRGGAR